MSLPALLLLSVWTLLSPSPASGSLMSVGGLLGSRGEGRHSGRPWDSHRRSYPQYYYRVAQEDEDRKKMMDRIRSEDEVDEDGKRPCVGLCYYKKVLALKNGKSGDGANMDQMDDDNEEPQEEIVFEELQTEKPCVGICQYYRQMGLEEPSFD